MKEWWFPRLIYCIYSTKKEKTKEQTNKKITNKKEIKIHINNKQTTLSKHTTKKAKKKFFCSYSLISYRWIDTNIVSPS